MIKVTCQLKDYSEPAQPEIKVHSDYFFGNIVELEVDGKRYRVSGNDLIEATKNAMNVGY